MSIRPVVDIEEELRSRRQYAKHRDSTAYDSSEDEDTVIVNSSLRTHPNDAGFTDFEDFGGLHQASPAGQNQASVGHQASRTLNLVDVSLSDDSPNSIDHDESAMDHADQTEEAPWNAFGELESPTVPSDPSNFGKFFCTEIAILLTSPRKTLEDLRSVYP